ncbi:MAG: TadE family protein [Planctomycetota bacterium]
MTRPTLSKRCSRSLSDRAGARRARRDRRRGAAVVEFAVCLPILVLLIFGSIEAASMIFLKQSLNVAAYEAAREAIRNGRTNADAQSKAANILAARNVVDFDVRFPRGESFDLPRGQEIIAEVSAPSARNSALVGQFISDRVITSRIVMIKQ